MYITKALNIGKKTKPPTPRLHGNAGESGYTDRYLRPGNTVRLTDILMTAFSIIL
jgi:hypothetical protein